MAEAETEERNDEIEIREVWQENLHKEFALIREIVDEFPYVSMDTEFPGVVVRPVGTFLSNSDYNYVTLKANVDLLKLIQLGLTFCDAYGNLPTCGTDNKRCVWQFNFREFNQKIDVYASDSITLLKKSGIDLEKNVASGIDALVFTELMMSSGVILNDDIHWVTFHSGYDFGYLLKMFTLKKLPETQKEFHELMRIYFPVFYDIKYLCIFLDNLYGGLNRIAEVLNVKRVGISHQAGSDSLLTSFVFQKLKVIYFHGETLKYSGVLYGLGKKSAGSGGGEVGFDKLVQWLVSFGWFVFSYEILGLGVIAVYGVLFLFASRTAAAYARTSSNFVESRLERFKFPTRGILQNLETLVAVGLIFALIFGVLFGGAFFSYKIAVESKDAVMSFKTHVQGSNYAERIGFKKWISENDIPGMVDQYSSKFYDSVWEQIDTMAAQHNMSDFANGLKQFITDSNSNSSTSSLHRMPSSSSSSYPSSDQTFAKKLQVLSSCFSRRDWSGISGEMYSILNELITTRQDLVDKAKDYAFQGVEVSKQVFSSSGLLVGGGISFFFSIALKLLSGAAEVLHLVSQSMVFFWLLYYLITSESGGATTQVMNMLPISEKFKGRCVEVINHAISSVLMATAKMAFFQGCLTLLVFRFFKVHFLYGSTFLAFLSPLLPLLPTWLSSVPMAIELFIEGRLILAAVLFIAHNAMIQYGAFAIQSDVSSHSAYLTSLSILGGMTLFTSALEGAIMGPLILTLVMALKNLYVEFVLGSAGTEEN